MCRVAVLGVVWLLYLLSPLDLIPEAVFGIVGLLDDLVIFVLIAMYLTFFFRSVPSCLLSPSFCLLPPASCPLPPASPVHELVVTIDSCQF